MFDIGEMSEGDILREVSENIDRLITVDLPFRTVSGKLYANTRALYDDPLTLLAASSLRESLQEREVVLIMFLIEERLITPMEKVCASAGFKVVSSEELMTAAESRAPLHAASIMGFPTEISEAEEVSAKLLAAYPVRAAISIEKGGMNERGIIHTSRGDDTTWPMAKIDILIRKAKEREILTIGIGDGGNEIGMGVIADELRRWLPYGKKCRCPCGGGIVPTTKTDLLVPAAVSNWGAHGISAMLALLEGNREIFHSPKIEQQVLHACVDAGLIDGGSGYVNGGVDSLPMHIHMSLVDLLGAFVDKGIAAIRTRS
jgi:hypothetical protein